jgi:hypothetical protein
MPEPIRLYALPPRMPPLAGATRVDELLDQLGAPAAGGIFEAADRHLARQAVWAQRAALVDPVEGEGAILAWCAMQSGKRLTLAQRAPRGLSGDRRQSASVSLSPAQGVAVPGVVHEGVKPSPRRAWTGTRPRGWGREPGQRK